MRGEHEVLAEVKGADLVGLTYRGPFDELPAQQGVTHRVIAWDDVSDEEGTGIVHIAPGAGAEDFALSKEYGLDVIAPLDEDGTYLSGPRPGLRTGFGFLEGHFAGDVPEIVFESLREKGLLYRVQDYTHRYPTCWRCGSELVFRLVDEWFISMDGAKHPRLPILEELPRVSTTVRRSSRLPMVPATSDRRPEIAATPARADHGGHAEGALDPRVRPGARAGLAASNMHDWMISKKRYYGLALPIFECKACGHFEVIGSETELKERAVEGWDEFEGHSPHRPYIDAVKIACSQLRRDGRAHQGRRQPLARRRHRALLDPATTATTPSTGASGSRRTGCRRASPASSATGSTPCWPWARSWRWTRSTRAQPPFKSLFSYALLRDEKGEEMHKSKGNAIWFEDAAERMGVGRHALDVPARSRRRTTSTSAGTPATRSSAASSRRSGTRTPSSSPTPTSTAGLPRPPR